MQDPFFCDQDDSHTYGAIDNFHRPISSLPQGRASRIAYFQQPPRDNTVPAVLATIFCFVPFGLVSVYYSIMTKRYYRKGKLGDSLKAAQHSIIFSQIAFVIGVMLWIGAILTYLLYKNGKIS